MAVIADRRDHPADGSYTAQLFSGGTEAMGAKLREEAAEVVDAAAEPGSAGHDHLVREAADLVYHLLVLLASRQVTLAEVDDELRRRFGTSGLQEKASRPAGGAR